MGIRQVTSLHENNNREPLKNFGEQFDMRLGGYYSTMYQKRYIRYNYSVIKGYRNVLKKFKNNYLESMMKREWGGGEII